MKRWMIASENENHKILHFNEDSFQQYGSLKIIPSWIMWLLNKFAYRDK